MRRRARYKATLHVFFGQFLRYNRDIALLLAAVSLLPVLMLSIRWGAWALDTSQVKFDLAFFVFRLAHAFLLLVCVFTVFDLSWWRSGSFVGFSPRQVSLRLGLSLSFMPLYYLAALSIGYYSGFLLLLYGPGARQRLHRHSTTLRSAYRLVPQLVYLLGGLMVIGLLLKNVPAIRAASARYLEEYARLATGSLPPQGAVVLSGDLARLALLQAELARQGKAEHFVAVGTHALYVLPSYRAWLRQKYPGWWPELKTEPDTAQGKSGASATNALLSNRAFLQMMTRLARSNHIYYLEPGIEFLREKFYMQPHGLVHEMKFYPPYSLSGPLLSPAELEENEVFWKQAIDSNVNPLIGIVNRPQLSPPDLKQPLTELERFRAPPPAQAQTLARWYSGALNRWGVTLQRNGRPSEAAPYFTLAYELNPDNLPARANLPSNSNLLAHVKMTVDRDRSFLERLDDYLISNPDLSDNGPFDEPSYCYHLALMLLLSPGPESGQPRMMRQACQELERTKALAPGDYATRLALGEALLYGGVLDQALQTAVEIRTDPDLQPLSPAAEVEAALLEASVWLAKTNSAKADAIISSLLASHPEAGGLADRAQDLFRDYGSYSNALNIVERQLQSAPDSLAALVNKGTFLVLMGDFSNAIPPLTRSLELTNTYAGRLNRAYAYMRSGHLDAAATDYQELLRAFPKTYRAYYWLGEIAWQNKDTNAAIRYYQQCLSNSAAGVDETKVVAARLKSLQPTESKGTPEPR